MERVNEILRHSLYRKYLQKNEAAEAERPFCRHDMGHFLDVARLGMIFALESRLFSGSSRGAVTGIEEPDRDDKMAIFKELIYAAALLHDIGRWKQYEDGTPHEKASAHLAPEILSDCGFTENETAQIVTAIADHRNEAVKDAQSLSGILYRADKMSRNCFCCKMEQACDWKGSRKNLRLTV